MKDKKVSPTNPHGAGRAGKAQDHPGLVRRTLSRFAHYTVRWSDAALKHGVDPL